MNVTVLEKFTISGRVYTINSDFTIHGFGCSLGQAKSLSDARKLLHGYVTTSVRMEYVSHQEQADKAKRVLDKLGNDPFYLGKFGTD